MSQYYSLQFEVFINRPENGVILGLTNGHYHDGNKRWPVGWREPAFKVEQSQLWFMISSGANNEKWKLSTIKYNEWLSFKLNIARISD